MSFNIDFNQNDSRRPRGFVCVVRCRLSLVFHMPELNPQKHAINVEVCMKTVFYCDHACLFYKVLHVPSASS